MFEMKPVVGRWRTTGGNTPALLQFLEAQLRAELELIAILRQG
jgi:hypothetical protein